MDLGHPANLTMYQHLARMEQAYNSNPAHANFMQKSHYDNITTQQQQQQQQQQYSQLPLRKEVDEEGRIMGVVLPKTTAHHSTEVSNVAPLQIKEVNAPHPNPHSEDSNHYNPHSEDSKHYNPHSDDSKHYNPHSDDSKHYNPQSDDSKHYNPHSDDSNHSVNGLKQDSPENVKSEIEEDINGFMEAAHDIFLRVGSKELEISEAAVLLGRPYAFVYSRYQEFCDTLTGKVKTTKKKRGRPKLPEEEKGKRKYKKRKGKKKSKSRRSGKTFQCEDCPAKFHTKFLYQSHSKLHLEDHESHECTSCGVLFARLGQLMKHRIEAHNDALQCPHCDKQYSVIASYQAHIKTTHCKVRPFICETCNKGFFSQVKLQDHQHVHTGYKPFMCGYCEKCFTSLASLNTHHITVHHGDHGGKGITKNFECEECGLRCVTNFKLKLHMHTHTGAKPYACDECDSRFNQKGILDRHKKMIHSNERPFKCNYCPATYALKVDLNRHNMVHTGFKPHKCHLCDYSCVKSHSLEHHINSVHTGKTPFKCDYYGCAAEYTSRNSLYKHKLKHLPPPVKSCNICNEKFPDMNSLNRHMMLHPGVEPLPCTQCDKVFYNQGSLNRHAYVHVLKAGGGKPKQPKQPRKKNPVKRIEKPEIPNIPTTHAHPIANIPNIPRNIFLGY